MTQPPRVPRIQLSEAEAEAFRPPHEIDGVPVPRAELTTHRQVAKALAVSLRQVTRWRNLGCDALARRPYDLAAIIEWIEEREANRGEAGRPMKIAQTLEELRKAKLQQEIRRIELDGRIRAVQAEILESSYYPRAAVEGMLIERTRALRAGLDLVELAAATEIVGLVRDGKLAQHEVSAAIRRELDHLYEAFSAEDFWSQLDERRRQVEGGVRVGGGRGRRVDS